VRRWRGSRGDGRGRRGEASAGARPGGDPTSHDAGFTDENGKISFPCRLWETYHGKVLTENQVLTTDPLSTDEFSGEYDWDCGLDGLISHDTFSDEGRVFVGITKVAEQTQALLETNRPPVDVKVEQTASGRSFYDRGSDVIHIDRDTGVWHEGGWFAQSHEYGHALHEKGLGGNPASGMCPDDRVFGGMTNLQCAFSEGFANYHMALTVGDSAASYFYEIRDNTLVNIDEEEDGDHDGAQRETAVAAFFFDLTTDVDDGSEDFDELNLPPPYLKDVIKTCEVKEDGVWIRGDGVDHYVYCLENQVDSEVTVDPKYFDTRGSDPTDFNESATEPAGWSPANIRALWRYDLYKESGG